MNRYTNNFVISMVPYAGPYAFLPLVFFRFGDLPLTVPGKV